MTRVHLIGIGGTGLSAIARILLETGYQVSGSDRAESPFTRELRSAGAHIEISHRAENVAGAEMVVRSSAISDDNPEVLAARAAGIPVLKRSDFLARIMENKTTIAVAGTHGKTTTTSMIAWMLTALGQDPSFIAGGVLSNLGVNARAGQGNAFVIEADEYDRMFLGLKPSIEVVTNIEYDHPDCFSTPEEYQAAFRDFVLCLPANGTLVAYAETTQTMELMAYAEHAGKATIAYGLRPASQDTSPARVYASVVKANELGGFTFGASVMGRSVTVELQVPGRHNVANALAALTVGQLLGLPLADSAEALRQFSGAGRRFEVRGRAGGVTVVDDYAHHPTEIRATLAAARARYAGRRLWAVWQPHTYSRTRGLEADFIQSFADADEVIVTEIYAAREPAQAYSAREIVEKMPVQAHFIASLPDVRDYLLAHLRPGDVLLVLSAGDADQVSTDVLARMKMNEVPHD
jgi:UDP-N-acetylmuramate--alanine ligase